MRRFYFSATAIFALSAFLLGTAWTVAQNSGQKHSEKQKAPSTAATTGGSLPMVPEPKQVGGE